MTGKDQKQSAKSGFFQQEDSCRDMEMRPFMIMIMVPLFFLLLEVCNVSGMRFDMDASDTKCFTEELNIKGLVLANYRVVSDNATKISVKVTSPYGSTMHSQERVNEGEFAFHANEGGDYTACFWIPEAPKESKISVELDWKTGVAAKDWDSIAKREKIDGVELELRKLEDAVKTIHDNMLYLREREEKMRTINEITNSRMAWFSIISLFICLVVAGLQLWHLKTFFEKKKLL